MPDEPDTTQLDSFVDQLDTIAPSDAVLEVRDVARREISLRVVPWEVPVMTRNGPEVIMRGAFNDADPSKVVLRLEHENPPAGKGIAYEDRGDGAYMTFKVSRTQRGDDLLTLAADGVATGVSPGFHDLPGGTQLYTRGGKRIRVVHRAALREVSTTWQPTWEDSQVLSIRSQSAQEEATMAESTTPAEVAAPEAPALDLAPLTAAITAMGDRMETNFRGFAEELQERSRSQFTIPQAPSADSANQSHRGDWMSAALRMLSGERIPDMQLRSLADLVTTDNVGVVPDAFSQEIIGVIEPQRPFLQTTRKLQTPDAGMSLVLPKIVTKPTVGVQAAEKDELTSTETSITNATFDAVTIGGAGDISLQLLKRSSPAYLSLYLELLAEAYSTKADDRALATLLTGFGTGGHVNDGGSIDPDDGASFGSAWQNAYAVRKPPTTIWLSSAAVAAYLDAKATTTNQPLYGNLSADFDATGRLAGSISGLRPVHVPSLDATDVDILVGPSSGFAWAEDGTYTLQVDVPAKAGRDVALVGILWFADMYPTSFTGYALGS